MRISSSLALGLAFAAGVVWSVSAASCASIGSGCIRNSDCSSGQICVASTCQIDPGSIEHEEAGDADASGSDDAHAGTTPDASVIVPSPDAKSSDVSSEAADTLDTSSDADTLDGTSDASEAD